MRRGTASPAPQHRGRHGPLLCVRPSLEAGSKLGHSAVGPRDVVIREREPTGQWAAAPGGLGEGAVRHFPPSEGHSGGRLRSGVWGAPPALARRSLRSEEHTSELQSPCNLVCRLLLEKKKKKVR